MTAPAVRRVFTLLGAYEDLTERESGALRRGDIDYAIGIENRKVRIARALADARQQAELTVEEEKSLRDRVGLLASREAANLELLRSEMRRVRGALQHLQQAAHRSRQVRRGYAGALPAVEGLLASA